MCHPIISLMSRPQEGGGERERQQGGQKKTDEEKRVRERREAENEKEGGREMERHQLGDFCLFSPPFPFPHTSESNWTKTVI